MVREFKPEGNFRNCLDLGCGTGLSGEPFKGLSRRLVGVDVSSGMLEQAKRKDIYSVLECEDVFAFLFLVLTLIFRPSGILGRKEVDKV